MNEIGVFGLPWHGLVRDGILTLPNADTMELPPEPLLLDKRYGDTFLVEMPWAPGATRSPLQAAEDQAQGRQWEKYAILGGGLGSIQGRPLPRGNGQPPTWLYGAPDKTVWAASFPRLNGQASRWDRSSISANMEFRRFGRIPARNEPIHTPWLGNIEVAQSDPPFVSGNTGSVYVQLADVAPDGSRAILEVCYDSGGAASNPLLTYSLFPVGFWMITLSGTPGVDLEIKFEELKTRRQTIGSLHVFDESVAATNIRFIHQSERTSDDVHTHWYEEGEGARVYTPLTRFELSGKVLAMWLDEDGEPTPLTLTSEYVRHESYEADQSQSGGPVTSVVDRSNWQRSSPITISSIESITKTANWSVVMRHKDAQLSWTGTGFEHATYHRQSSMTFLGGGVGIDQGQGSWTEVTGGAESPGGTTTEYVDYGTGLPRNDNEAMTAWPPRYLTNASIHLPSVIRYSNKAFSWIQRMDPTGEGPARHWACITPAGLLGSPLTCPPGARYGSFNPATNELERGQVEPVRWV